MLHGRKSFFVKALFFLAAVFSLVVLGHSCRPRAKSGLQSAGSGKMSVYRVGNRTKSVGNDYFLDDIQPVLAKNCVTCHACSESPCQLKLDSYTGLMRGVSPVDPYSLRIKDSFTGGAINTSNEFQYSTEEWHKRQFKPVISADANAPASIFAKALGAGRRNTVGSDLRQIAAEHANTCPLDVASYDQFISGNPQMGMPFGLPTINDKDFETLTEWINKGAVGPSTTIQQALDTPTNPDAINRWEAFFFTGLGSDGYGPHVDIVGRYIYEHIYLSDIHIEESPGEFYKLVRSMTPPGQPLREIFTALPYDNPGIQSRVYYRLKKITNIIARKNHIVWRLNDQRLKFYQDLFFGGDRWWSAQTKVPGYTTNNPFIVFQAIPPRARYQWLLDNMDLLIDHMTRGPVCVGSLATYVVDDHFWGWFLDPDSDPAVADPTLGMGNFDAMGIKVGTSDVQRYLQAWESSLRKLLASRGKKGLSVEDIWDGQKGSPYKSKSAWTTMLRHDGNMTVHTGLTGGFPQSIWISSFSHMERLYYDLVASFDPYGNIQHKTSTWNFMNFIRTEAEDLYISLLPEDQRQQVRDEWNSGLLARLKQWRMGQTSIVRDALMNLGYRKTNMLSEGRPAGGTGPLSGQIIATKVMRRIQPELDSGGGDLLNNWPVAQSGWEVPQVSSKETFEAGLRTLTNNKKWGNAQFFPNVTYVRISVGGQSHLYSLIANRQFNAHNIKYAQGLSRRPEDDSLIAYRGIKGNYPNLFLDLKMEEAADALREMQLINSEEKWQKFSARYAVQRNSEKFWPFVEWLNSWQEDNDPIDGGILELREYGFR